MLFDWKLNAAYDSSMKKIYFLLMSSILSFGCATTNPPPTVPKVDLERFMGDWYVVGGILTFLEKGAHHAIESYRLDEEGRIQTTFTFRKDSFDGPLKKYTPVGFVHDKETNAEWRMQFIWPFKAPFLIIYLDDEYKATAIATDSKRYLWIMSRTPQMPEHLYNEIIALVTEQGFDVEKIVKVPQPEEG
jgi:apolipoprotein D and lipocalin family protein